MKALRRIILRSIGLANNRSNLCKVLTGIEPYHLRLHPCPTSARCTGAKKKGYSEMSHKLRNGVRQAQRAGAQLRGRLQTSQALRQTAEIEFTDESREEEVLPESDSPEPPEIEIEGDSDVVISGPNASSPFDSEWLSALPLIYQLPFRARPIVRFYIDERIEVHKIDRGDDDITKLRHLIASAIAEHIKEQNVSLRKIGDWCHIPAIKDDEGLIGLLSTNVDRESLRNRLEHMGSDLKAFAIALPSGDVVTPQALISLAQDERKATRIKSENTKRFSGKRATRAGALRVSSRKPSELAGEQWTEEDWSRFEDTQRKKRRGGKGGVQKPSERQR